MSEDLRQAMHGRMVALCTSITTLNATADGLVRSADLLDRKPAAKAMRDVARRQRVKILEMQGRLAALNVTYTERFGTGP
ncbi:hypothetical protein [Methylobacterium sp. 22177]|uniref:hypothetical protein n=1 Tax=Methylobacterium sp. 22177 TaxID=3453885 RepID=UPI003F8364CD